MPKQFVLRIKGVPTPAVVRADQIEETGQWIVLRRGDNVIAQYKVAEVVSWEIEE